MRKRLGCMLLLFLLLLPVAGMWATAAESSVADEEWNIAEGLIA